MILSGTASVATRPAPYGYDSRRILIGNGMAQPGQMDSAQFRKAKPRRVGPAGGRKLAREGRLDELKVASYDIQSYPGSFKSGRPKLIAHRDGAHK